MKIKTYTYFSSFVLLTVLIVLFLMIDQGLKIHSEINEKLRHRSDSKQLAHELLQSSEDLTRMARSYLVTGDPIYKEYFNRILDIRNGKIPRPKDSLLTYWLLESVEALSDQGQGSALALTELLRDNGLTTAELELLEKAQIVSDQLVETERRAFAALEGLFDNGQGEYTIRGEPDRELAIKLLWDADYNQQKALIMQPIKQFMEMLEARTMNDVQEAQDKLRSEIFKEMTLLGILVVSIIGAVVYVRKNVLNPLKLLTSRTEAIVKGNYSVRCKTESKNEIGQLGASFNAMVESIEKVIDEHLQAENQLRLSESRLREAQHIAQVGNWELNLLEDRLHWSDEIYRIFEIDPTKFAASYESFLDLIHPDDRKMVDKAFTESLKTRHPYNIVHRLLMPDGRIKYVRERGETIYKENGDPVRSLGTVQDISYLRQIEKKLKSADERMHLVLKATHDGIWDWNLQTHEDYLSPRWKEIVGYRDEELPNIEASFFELVHPGDQQAVKEAIKRHLENKDPYCVEMRLRHKDGSYRWILSRGEAIRDVDGKPVRMVGAITDITDLKEAHEELRLLNNELEFRVQQRTAQLKAARDESESASQAKSKFLSRMSHELRTPMNAILGFSQLLEIEELPSEAQGYVHEIHRAGDYLLELINELLDLSRIETGKMSVFLQPINVDHAVKTAVEIVHQQMGEKGIRFSLDCQSELSVMADSTRLRQILVNLLSNAVKYNVPNGTIKVTCHAREDGFLRISVIDTGPGIAIEHQANLFVPFERLGAEHSAVEGTGIGLALSKQLAELMGGMLGFESLVHEGKGALFWLDLPIATRAIKTEVNRNRDKDIITDEQHIIILYIEDNSANLRVVEGMLRRRPRFKLIAATSGEEGLKLAQRFNPSVILLDIHLPGMDGYAVLDELRRNPETQQIPVVALSADAMDIDVKRGLEAGFKYYLTKPVKMNALFNTIERCLDEL